MGKVDYFRIPRNPPRTDAQRGDHFLQADFTGLIPPWKPDSFRLADDSPRTSFFVARSAFVDPQLAEAHATNSACAPTSGRTPLLRSGSHPLDFDTLRAQNP